MPEEVEKSKRRRSRKHRPPPGASPGTLVIDPNAPKPSLYLMAYGPDSMEERELKNPREVERYLGQWPVTWINVDGLGDKGVLEAVGEIFHLHRLALEDVVNTHQRSKVEQYGDLCFIVSRMTLLGERLQNEQLSLFLGKNFVLTFQETKGDCFDPVRQRIRQGLGRILQAGPDYLTYALIDAVIDNYFPILEEYGEKIEALEEEVIRKPDQETIQKIHQIKRDLLSLRRAVWPKRESLSTLSREPYSLFTDETRIYLRDCYDHAIQLMDMIETYRELSTGLMDIYQTSLGNKMNEIMKVLTIIATIFIPLGFIAGIYGMNFSTEKSSWNMPELSWKYGYFYCLTLMAMVALGLLVYFWRKGWLNSTGKK